MINLYEFLGITKDSNIDDIQAAIDAADKLGKSDRNIELCKKYLLNDAMREKYNQALSADLAIKTKTSSTPAHVKTTPMAGNVDGYENYKKYNEEGNTVAANRALGKSYAFEAIYTYIKNM